MTGSESTINNLLGDVEVHEDVHASLVSTLNIWMEAAEAQMRNADFYRGLLDKCAEAIGKEAYTDDSGYVHNDPIRMKIPELVSRPSRLLSVLREEIEFEDEEDLRDRLSALSSVQAQLTAARTQNDAAIRQLNQAYRVIDKLTAYIDKLEAGR